MATESRGSSANLADDLGVANAQGNEFGGDRRR